MNPVISREYVEKNYISRKRIENELKEIERMKSNSITAEAFNIFHGECIVLRRILEGTEDEDNIECSTQNKEE